MIKKLTHELHFRSLLVIKDKLMGASRAVAKEMLSLVHSIYPPRVGYVYSIIHLLISIARVNTGDITIKELG